MLMDFLQLSLAPLLIGTCASVTCALLGNFLILRRQSLIGDETRRFNELDFLVILDTSEEFARCIKGYERISKFALK